MKVILNVSLFYNHFSSRKAICNKNYRCANHAVDRFVGAIDRRFPSSPLLNCVCGSLFKVRSAREKVLSRKNMTPSLEDTLPSRKCIPGVSPGKGEACRRDVISARLRHSVACLHYSAFNCINYISTSSYFQISLGEQLWRTAVTSRSVHDCYVLVDGAAPRFNAKAKTG